LKFACLGALCHALAAEETCGVSGDQKERERALAKQWIF
jgi:hypothetical protein